MNNSIADIPKGPPSTSLGDWMTEVLKERLAGGGYQPGEWIREPALQREFGISNGPVREALQNLVAAGALVREARRGVRVVDLSNEEVIELFQVRLALLELSAELVAKSATPKDIKSGQDIIDKLDKALQKGDVEALMQAGGSLVDWVCFTTKNQQLIGTWERLTLKARVYIYASLKACQSVEEVAKIWRTLYEAIAAGDEHNARKATQKIIRRTLQDLSLTPNF